MEQEQEDSRVYALRALANRGRLQVNPDNKEDIAKAMAPLPPPWEWQAMREVIGLTASDAYSRTGFKANRIRYWERGGGTMYPEQWLRYATALVDLSVHMMQESEQASRVLAEVRSSSDSTNQRVLSLQDLLRSLGISMEMWLEQESATCTPADAVRLMASVRETSKVLRLAERVLQRVSSGRNGNK